MLKRLDRVDVATLDLNDAASVYQKNFGFRLKTPPDGETAVIAVGDAEIKLIAGPRAAAAIKAGGEGMVALWLEAEDLEAVKAALDAAGLQAGPIVKENGRRVLALDPRISSRVPLFIFDRKA